MSEKRNQDYTTENLFVDLKAHFTGRLSTWKVKQNDVLDAKTSFIYSVRSLAELKTIAISSGLLEQEISYAEHRWCNFKRHDAWLSLINEHWPGVILATNPRDRDKDFTTIIEGTMIDYDLKVTRLPKSLDYDIDNFDLAQWMYINQSSQSRFHLKNRVFIVADPESSLYEFTLARDAIKSAGLNLSSLNMVITLPDSSITPYSIVIRV